ncbi:GGDEF domain-containing protein [Pseudomonas vancouverensis]|uniref:diguanylate cyclase n=1 Tax=Pseudomonas vancouverensis TaxID=95300 RepID=A0A1H2PD04_PSEVA|nr:GGDEF domain-containing protein [Pseudomonas vancouverensis]KAB0497977.1 diguanylate cyclase [Pseudomonas vancouverensis]TDB66704.1 diguanylate cyclase [Pseudomonas vancouverensis]SDV15609.1 diguanylate cyclase [Pseudomonas vancouverensis]
MSDEAQRWKEKYLKSIEQQEKLERRWDARLDLLRRGLVRSTLAAEGTDRAVDQCMKEMREVVRTDDMDARLAALIPRLEKAVLDSEQRRETRVNQTSAALNALVTQLQTLPLPRDVSRPLKSFAKQLDARVSQAREIPLLLSELSGLQGKALSQLETPAEPERPGLLQRLFGKTEAEGASAADIPAPIQHAVQSPVEAAPELIVDAPVARVEPATVVIEPVKTEPLVADPVEPESATAEPMAEESSAAEIVAFVPPVVLPQPTATDSADVTDDHRVQVQPPSVQQHSAPDPELSNNPDELTAQVLPDDAPELPAPAETVSGIDAELSEQDAHYALPDTPEPSYSSVASHIEETLLGLLDDLTLPERHRPQAESMRDRLKNGLNWYELLPILDDFATLMLAITDSGQHEFEAYLQRLNERLESFQSNLQAATAGHADNRSAAREMDTQIREQVDGLQSSMKEAADLDDLKLVLENHLEGLLGTMDQHQKQRDEREQEVAARLHSLAERVAHMEEEAQGYREHLEEQRQKALVDPLTGLPNRAAWSERLDQEVKQWQQHGNTLLLAMLDLDHFKRINDNYGHLAGDKVLKIIATVLRKRLRGTDFIARFGGEEFVLLMPATAQANGLKLMESLRAAIEACPFHFKGEPVTITVSIGMTAFRAGEHGDQVLKRADQALYRAKNAGRNRVEAG